MVRDPTSIVPARRLPLATFTAAPANWGVPLGQLDTVDVERRVAKFRQHLNRVAAGMADKPSGWLFAGLHGAYDPALQMFPLHIHGVASGGMIEAVNGLRKLGVYEPAKAHDGRDAANTPILINRNPHSMPQPLHYFLLQRWWPLRETSLGSDGIRRAVGGPRQQIHEPAYSEYMLFLDRWRIDQMTLRMGITVSANGLVAR